ncbi:hypothetical protein HK102_013162 [Quaeritorhiza haematococci]|nr:hypothetical protein HK102_013162 [Quaeritorhiza haematococci]
MAKPYSKGAFRSAYYAKDINDGKRYTVKIFHVLRGLQSDLQSTSDVSKSYAFATALARIFEEELQPRHQAYIRSWQASGQHLMVPPEAHLLTRRFLHMISYVDSWFAEVEPWFANPSFMPDSDYVGDTEYEYDDEGNALWPRGDLTCVMIEPHLDTFEKWLNNNADKIDDDPDSELMATIMHWSFVRSAGKLILADLQGHKTVFDQEMPTPFPTPGFPGRPPPPPVRASGVQWTLSDPAIHVLLTEADEGTMDGNARKLLEDLSHDLGGNLGIMGEQLLKEKHRCNDFCAMLGLRALS